MYSPRTKWSILATGDRLLEENLLHPWGYLYPDAQSFEAAFDFVPFLGSNLSLILSCTNHAGLESVAETSYMADYTMPLCSFVHSLDPLGELSLAEYEYVSHMSKLVGIWECSDPESGIETLQIGVGSNPGSDDIVPFRIVPSNTTAWNFTVEDTKRGQPRYVSLRLTNGAG